MTNIYWVFSIENIPIDNAKCVRRVNWTITITNSLYDPFSG